MPWMTWVWAASVVAETARPRAPGRVRGEGMPSAWTAAGMAVSTSATGLAGGWGAAGGWISAGAGSVAGGAGVSCGSWIGLGGPTSSKASAGRRAVERTTATRKIMAGRCDGLAGWPRKNPDRTSERCFGLSPCGMAVLMYSLLEIEMDSFFSIELSITNPP